MPTPPQDASLRHHAALDARLVAAVRGIRLLQEVSWPARAQEEFLAAWRIGRIHLPKPEYRRGDWNEVRAELEAVHAGADPDEPIGRYLRATAESWRITTRLLDAVGSHRVTATDCLGNQRLTEKSSLSSNLRLYSKAC